jgi:hypothetical protein
MRFLRMNAVVNYFTKGVAKNQPKVIKKRIKGDIGNKFGKKNKDGPNNWVLSDGTWKAWKVPATLRWGSRIARGIQRECPPGCGF